MLFHVVSQPKTTTELEIFHRLPHTHTHTTTEHLK